eukprot:3776581-Rhodomonas_salina.3
MATKTALKPREANASSCAAIFVLSSSSSLPSATPPGLGPPKAAGDAPPAPGPCGVSPCCPACCAPSPTCPRSGGARPFRRP